MDTYEGDWRCEMSEGPDDPCTAAALQVWREPYTSKAFKVYVCAEHAGHCEGFGYRRDLEAEQQLAIDKQREMETV